MKSKQEVQQITKFKKILPPVEKFGRWGKYALTRSYDDLPKTKRAIEQFFTLGSKKGTEFAEMAKRNYASQLSHFFHFCHKEYTKITIEDVEDFWKRHVAYRRQNNLSQEYDNQIAVTLVSFFKFLVRTQKIKRSPVGIMSITKLPEDNIRQKIHRQVMSREDVSKFLSTMVNPRDLALFTVMFYHGARISEVANLKVNDVNLNKNFITFRESKGGKTRVNPMLPIVSNRLRTWLKIRQAANIKPDYKDFVFTTKFGKRLDTNDIRDIFHKHLSKSGIQNSISGETISKYKRRTLTPHSARHTAITFMLQDGISMEQIADFVGHGNVNTTKRYADMLRITRSNYFEKFKGY